jgi:hypothetical protein
MFWRNSRGAAKLDVNSDGLVGVAEGLKPIGIERWPLRVSSEVTLENTRVFCFT